jgi:hypothetical protein
MGGVSSDNPAMVVSKVPGIVRSTFTNTTTVTFPAGGLTDQQPIINLLMEAYATTERVDTYFDCGATDSAKDLDVIDSNTMYPLYKDPAYTWGVVATVGVLPPKAVMIRCLKGSGLIYLNVAPDLGSTSIPFVAPLPLHANAGAFYYTFPRNKPHYATGDIPLTTDPVTAALCLSCIHLRTFEAANRFQLLIFK